MSTKIKWWIPVFLVLSSLLNIKAQDWPQYLGPERNGTSPQKGILRSWPEGGPEVLWTVPVGIGFGGPVVKDGKVYLLDRYDNVGDIMRCFDLTTGMELWKYSYDAPGSVMFPGSRSVPALDENYVYSCGHNGDLYCTDINTHKPVWNNNIWTDFGGDELPIWAITQCPIVLDDLVIVLSQAPEAGAVAYDKLTGKLVWKTPYLGNESYASPSVVKIAGENHVVVVISSTNPIGHRELPQTLGKIVGIQPATGKILWEYDQWHCHISVPSAVDAGNNKILVVGGYELGAAMIEVKKNNDGNYVTSEVFKTEEFGDQTKPPLLIEGYFYAQFGTNRRRDGLACMNMDGEIMWKTKRDPDFNKGSMVLADGLILATDGMKTLYLIEPDPSGFKPLASADLLEIKPGDERMARRFATQNWAPIALADGKLLIRDQGRIMCIKVAE
jgi:outer membrane protein assembly factor BamB